MQSRSRPAQMVIKIVHDDLVEMLGGGRARAAQPATPPPPVPILMVGLQGSGKTTTTAKIALRLKAARAQEGADGLARHPPSGGAGAAGDPRPPGRRSTTLPIVPGEPPVAIARRALQHRARSEATTSSCSTPPGGSHIDEEMMAEVAAVRDAAQAGTRRCSSPTP